MWLNQVRAHHIAWGSVQALWWQMTGYKSAEAAAEQWGARGCGLHTQLSQVACFKGGPTLQEPCLGRNNSCYLETLRTGWWSWHLPLI